MFPVLVVSPHLDDAVLSAGQFLLSRPNNITVATLFAGIPPADTITDYDRKCGFATSREAVLTRRREDTEALAMLGGPTPLHLDYLDFQYGGTDDMVDDIVDTLAALVKAIEPEFVLAPLGLLHPDHVRACNVTLAAAMTIATVVLYEELPYRVTHPEYVTEALDEVRAQTGTMEPTFIGDGPLELKQAAIGRYRSQMSLPEFQPLHSVLVPERFWRVT